MFSWISECPGNKPVQPVLTMVQFIIQSYITHGLINFIDTKANCRRLKTLTNKGTLRQVFIRDYRLEIQSVMLVFLTQLCELLPL